MIVPSTNHGNVSLLPLVLAEKEQLKKEVASGMNTILTDYAEEIIILNKRQTELNKTQQDLNREKENLNETKEKLQKRQLELKKTQELINRMIQEVDHAIQETNHDIQEVDRDVQKTNRDIQANDSKQRKNLVNLFYQIFYETKPIPTQIDTLFSTYANKAISFDEEKHCFKLSTQVIVNYLKVNTNIEKCDFRYFKAEIVELSTLAKYLITHPFPKVKVLIFNAHLLESDKKLMEAVIEARKENLQIQYTA